MKKRAGRKRKLTVRYPNGRGVAKPLHARVDAMLEVVLEARQRVFGLSPEHASQVEAVDALGRLRLLGNDNGISESQYEAGKVYAATREDYHRVMLARPVPSAGDLERQPGFDGSDGSSPGYVDWCQEVEADYKTMRRALLECGDALASMVVDGIIDGVAMFDFVGTLRVALNALARVTNQKARAA